MVEKKLYIKGMSCGHCSARVEKALNNIDGVEAKVDLKTNSATVSITIEVSDKILKNTVDDLGYNVLSIE